MEDGTIEKVGIWDLWHDLRPMGTQYVKFTSLYRLPEPRGRSLSDLQGSTVATATVNQPYMLQAYNFGTGFWISGAPSSSTNTILPTLVARHSQVPVKNPEFPSHMHV